MKHLLFLTCLALIANLSGCGGGSNTSTVKVDGITVTAIQPAGNHSFSGETAGGFTRQRDAVTGLEFMVKDKELSVNGKKYGKLAAGDIARIQDGSVFVNDKERPPEGAVAGFQNNGAANKDDPARKEVDKLNGGWACVGYEEDGVERSGKAARKTQYNEELSFTVEHATGGRLHLRWTLGGVESGGAGVFQLHSKSEPKGIDLKWEGGGYEPWGKGPPPKYRDKIQPGVYSVEGDRLRLCWGEIGSDRPTSVRTKQGDNRTVLIYERNTSGFGIGER